MVHGAYGVDFGLVAAGDKGGLRALDDVEVVVCRVAAGVAFRADCGAEDQEVLRDAWSSSVRNEIHVWGINDVLA